MRGQHNKDSNNSELKVLDTRATQRWHRSRLLLLLLLLPLLLLIPIGVVGFPVHFPFPERVTDEQNGLFPPPVSPVLRVLAHAFV